VKYYKGNFKYTLADDESVSVDFFVPAVDIITDFIEWKTTGLLLAKTGYAWDGASGPTWDDKTNLTPSLFHDVIAQLMRMQLVPKTLLPQANEMLREMCVTRGMWRIRAWYWIKGLKLTGGSFADKKNRRKIHYAP